ncbi:MAG: type I-E CRISPR-associated protein Cas7/Cse4/CasC [Gemmatimonadales bacterium]|nr:type I-E CRISPR-associated protein Cas7/Cse4/CasC [Gemmatimonadales bacterium]
MGDFLQIHSLVSYPGVLLNRDDVGLAKRLPFGDAVRIRVSSQCLKKHWREAVAARHPELPAAVRSREILTREIRDWLEQQEGVSPAAADSAVRRLADVVLKSKEKQEDKPAADDEGQDGDGEAADELKTGQVIVLSRAEIDRLRTVALRLAKSEGSGEERPDAPKKAKGAKGKAKTGAEVLSKEDQEELRSIGGSFDMALFGRFVTSELLARVDAAASVAHAFTVHGEQAETDYFTAVDMLDARGAAMVGDAELTSGVFYVYVVIDLDQLRDNLPGRQELAEPLAAWLVEAIATVSPGAKRGSTAPYAWSEFVLLERGSAQPRTLANAFRSALPLNSGQDVLADAVQALLGERKRLEAMYGELVSSERVVVASTHPASEELPRQPLHAAIKAVLAV